MTLHSNSLKKIIPFLHIKPNFFTPTSPKTFYTIISHYSNLIHTSLTPNSIHAQLIKTGLNTHTFLCNRILDSYSKLGHMDETFKLFDEMPNKNVFTWNVLLNGLLKNGDLVHARCLFDEMPERDVVSWNSMISGYMRNGFFEYGLEVFGDMQNVGINPSVYTFSVVISCLLDVRHGKEVHGRIVRSGLGLGNVVICNGLIDMYGRFKVMDYAFGVFLAIEEKDVVSWNSLIAGCGKSDYGELGLIQFCSMRSCGYSPDEHTISTVITVCSNLHALEKGEQVFALCFKMGFNSNSIVMSAAIDMFSKSDRLVDSVRLFEEMNAWDVALCDTMISCYVRQNFYEDASRLFAITLEANTRPTEFTLSNILTSASCALSVEQGTQVHSLVLKLGFESETVISSSLVDMYAKVGLIDSAFRIFQEMTFKDLVSWNKMIIGFARNGRELEALETFEKLLEEGLLPDRITLAGVLLACSHKGLLTEGCIIFTSMEEAYGVIPGVEHYAFVVEMMCRAGKLAEAMEFVQRMPYEPNAFIHESLLVACKANSDLELTERVAETLMELEPRACLPYMVLGQAYETSGKWERLARVKRIMKVRGISEVNDCSWIGIKTGAFVFYGNTMLPCASEGVYLIMALLVWEMVDEGYVCQCDANIVDGHGWG